MPRLSFVVHHLILNSSLYKSSNEYVDNYFAAPPRSCYNNMSPTIVIERSEWTRLSQNTPIAESPGLRRNRLVATNGGRSAPRIVSTLPKSRRQFGPMWHDRWRCFAKLRHTPKCIRRPHAMADAGLVCAGIANSY